MSTPIETQLVTQLEDVLGEWRSIQARSQYDDCSDLPLSEVRKFATRARSAIDRIAGPRSRYSEEASESMAMKGKHFQAQVLAVVGVVEALKADVEAGYLTTLRELIHADLFSNFLEMAEHLLDEGYKDAAAVIGGSTLESHLRQLCDKHGISTVNSSSKGTRPKKADALNSELAGAAVYSKLDQKGVTSWLDLRNKAAHGHYAEYTKEQVALLLQSLQDFMMRNPA